MTPEARIKLIGVEHLIGQCAHTIFKAAMKIRLKYDE